MVSNHTYRTQERHLIKALSIFRSTVQSTHELKDGFEFSVSLTKRAKYDYTLPHFKPTAAKQANKGIKSGSQRGTRKL